MLVNQIRKNIFLIFNILCKLFDTEIQERRTMKKALISFLATLAVSAIGSHLYSQAPAAQPEAQTISLNNYSPTAITDKRFYIKDISFYHRVDPNGLGEFLDTAIDLRNRTTKPLELIAYAIAFNESDAVDKNSRAAVPYPAWRDNDPAKNFFLVHNVAVSPNPVQPDQIWSPADPDYKEYQKVLNRIRNSVGTSKPVEDTFPPIYKYIAYLSRKPAEGLAFRLPGTSAPAADQRVLTNYIAPTEEQKKNKSHPEIHKHTYTVEMMQRQSILRTHHFAPYMDDYKYFTHVSILILDPNKNVDHEGNQTEGPAVVYYRTYKIKGQMKIN